MTDAGGAGEPITYLIANRDRALYLPACIASLRRQTDPTWLALVCDDASADDSLRILAGVCDERIRVLRNDSNLGYTSTLRRLVEEASTDLVAILDSDDVLAPEATERLRAAYARNPDAEFVYSRFAAYDESLTICRGVYGTAVPPGGTALRDASIGQIRSFRRRAYHRTAGLDPSMEYAEDRDLVYKLEEVTRPIFLSVVLYHYRELPDSQSHDPVKREAGIRNTRRARRSALRRRRVNGIRRLLWEAYIQLDFLASSDRTPSVLRFAAAGVLHGAKVAGGLRRAVRRAHTDQQ